MTEVIFSGFGGQGVLTMGVLFSHIALQANKKVSWLPSYGAQMRGGTANCTVKVGDEEIPSPYSESLDVLVAMNDPSINLYMKAINPGGILLVDTGFCKTQDFRDDITVIKVDASKIAQENGNARGANVVMVGAMMAATKMFDLDFAIAGMRDYFSGKKPEILKSNDSLLKVGYELVQ